MKAFGFRVALFSLGIAFFFSSCSRMLWRESSLNSVRSLSETGRSVLIVENLFEEKDSWNPLNGTTDKRNYRSRLKVQSVPESGTALESAVFPSWTLPNPVFYHEGKKRIFLVQGLDDAFGSRSRKLSILQVPSFQEERNSFRDQLPPGYSVVDFLPSPDGTKLGLVMAEHDSEGTPVKFVAVHLDLAKGIATTKALEAWWSGPEYKLGWSKDSGTLFWKLGPSALSFQKDWKTISQFPKDSDSIGYGNQEE